MKKLSVGGQNIVFCRSVNRLLIRIYIDGSLKCVVKSSLPIQDYSIGKHTGKNWLLFCFTVDGKLYGVHKDKVFNPQQKQESLSEEDDIFQDLLTSTDLHLSQATEDVVHLNSSHILYDFESEHLTGLSAYNNIVLLISKCCTYSEVKVFINDVTASLSLRRTVPIGHISNFYTTYFIVSESSCTEDYITGNSIVISHELFLTCFGSELSLLKSPIIFICPSSGSVFYTPLKCLEEQTESFSDKYGSLKLFCNTSQHVVCVQTIKFISKWEEQETESKDGLIIVGADGKCLVVSSWRSGGAQFVPVTIPGPVQCCDVYGSSLYHSDDRDVFESQVSTTLTNNRIDVSVVKQISLGTSSVCNLVALQNSSLVEGAPCQLLFQCRNNVCRLIDLAKNKDGGSGVKSGQQIKDILVSLEKCHLERKRLTEVQKQHNSFMSQLSIANFLICSQENSKMFDHLFKITYSPHSLEFSLCYELTNQSKVSVSHDWKLFFTVQNSESNQTKSVLFNLSDGLKQNECVSMTTSIPEINIYLPLEVRVYLHLQIPEGLLNTTELLPNVLPIFLTCRVLDILNFVGDEKHHKKYVNSPPVNIKTVVSDLASCRPISHCLLEPEERSDTVVEPVTLVISKPLEVMNYKEVRRKGKGEIGLLLFLLQDCSPLPEVTGRSVSLSVCGGPKAVVCVSIEDKVVISIQSTNQILCTSLRVAVIRRFQILEKKPEMTMSLQQVQSKLKVHQDILKEINHLEETEHDTLEKRKKIQQIYWKLRNTDVLT